jgi:hypothetical protein
MASRSKSLSRYFINTNDTDLGEAFAVAEASAEKQNERTIQPYGYETTVGHFPNRQEYQNYA